MVRSRSQLLSSFLSLLVIALTFSNTALSADPSGKGISMMTLHMQRMTQLETALHTAVNAHDSASLDKLLSPFFEVRRTGCIVDRDTWIREGVRSDGELHQLSAYEVGNEVIANFLLIAPGQPTRFVVDVWTHDDDEWRLRVRFETIQLKGQSKLRSQPMPNNK